MFCYNCGCQLTKNDFCTNCYADVKTYKKVMYAANRFYNLGLEKARIRDLSGAADALRCCLKLNKDHIEARNLLGLVYYEVGETFSALNEWVMSVNIQERKNIAHDFIGEIQENLAEFDEEVAAAKKYNNALELCFNNNIDVAKLSLKTAIKNNKRHVQAHLLLALILMAEEENAEAMEVIKRVLKIDHNNTMALRYKKELEGVSRSEEELSPRKNKKSKKQLNEEISSSSIAFQNGSDGVIKPINTKEATGLSTVVNIIIGAVIGVAISLFLILPARIKTETDKVNDKIAEYSEEIAVKAADIKERDSQIEKLEREIEKVHNELDSFTGDDGTITSYDNLLAATASYLSGEGAMRIADSLSKIDEDYVTSECSETFLSVYNFLREKIGIEVSQAYYESGVTEYNSENFSEAIRYLEMAVSFDKENSTALYQLGEAYYRSGNIDQAIEIYTEVIELFPGSNNAYNAQKRISAINGEG